MKIQIGHLRKSNYEEELYKPLKNSEIIGKHDLIFPHDNNGHKINSRKTLKEVDLFIAEVSEPATGLGIELGFTTLYKTRIICIYKKGSKISNSLKYICNEFIEYESIKDMIEQIEKRIK